MVLSWAAFWAFLGSLLASLGPLGLPCGLSWASLGPILDHFGTSLGLSWRLLEKSWTPAGLLGRFLASSRPSLSLLDPPCSPVASPEAFLEAFWDLFRPFKGCIWSFSHQSKASLGPPGRLMGSARASFGLLQHFIGHPRHRSQTLRDCEALKVTWGWVGRAS